jgi:uncharacterized membrane protein
MLLGAGGVMHFAKPKSYDAVIPDVLPGKPRTWTYASGVAELVVAAAVASPKTRRFGGLLAAGLFAAIFPANVKMAGQFRDKGPKAKFIAYGRLPLQIPLIVWALRVRRSAP